MNLTTSQWRGVRSAMPFSRAISSPIASFHCAGSVRKPSGSTSTLRSAIIVMVISSSFLDRDRMLLAGHGHGRPDAGDLSPRQEPVPVEPLEHELPEVVEARFPEQRERARGGREAAGQRLDLV